MQQMQECSTGWLSVTELVNERWADRLNKLGLKGHSPSSPDLLCSDAITVRAHQLEDPGFDAATYVMDTALAHTERYCKEKGVRIPGFQSVEVLRFAQPRSGALSFLFLMESRSSA